MYVQNAPARLPHPTLDPHDLKFSAKFNFEK